MNPKEKRYINKLPNDYLFIKRIKDLGIPTNYMGFYYIIEIMDLLINRNVVVKSFSKQIYPVLAEKYNKKICTVERDIRNVILKFWDNDLRLKLTDLWQSENRPTCCQLIYVLKSFIIKEVA